MKLYLEFTSSPCIRGGGCSIEHALQTLYETDGNVMKAMERLIANKDDLDGWSMGEQLMFERSIVKHGKRFDLISQDIKTKSVKKCIEFYYLWKHSPSRSPSVNYQPKTKFLNATNSNTQQTITSGTLVRQPLAQSCNITTSQQSANCSNEINNNSKLITNNNGNIIVDNTALFLCKVCGRAFEKIKSRSAHMKRHKNERYPLQ